MTALFRNLQKWRKVENNFISHSPTTSSH